MMLGGGEGKPRSKKRRRKGGEGGEGAAAAPSYRLELGCGAGEGVAAQAAAAPDAQWLALEVLPNSKKTTKNGGGKINARSCPQDRGEPGWREGLKHSRSLGL